MALTVKHATLSTRLYDILLTPFFFVAAIFVLDWWVFALLAFICLGLWLTGSMQFDLPPWAEIKEELIIGGLLIGFLWIVATFLTIFDHLRFKGWTHCETSGETTARAEGFLDALVQGKNDDAAVFLDGKLKSSPALSDRFADWRKQLGTATEIVKAEQLSTTDYVVFCTALPVLKKKSLDRDQIFLLVSLIEGIDVPVGAPMKVALFSMRPDFSNDFQDFEVLEIPRPELLS